MTLIDAFKSTENMLMDAGIDDYRFDSECLLIKAADKTRRDVLCHGDDVLSEKDEKLLLKLAKRRALGEPLQYILGEWDFCEFTFNVGEGVLIPRPETEMLVENADLFLKNRENAVVYDLCSGSGCIGITVKNRNPSLDVYLMEKYPAALSYTVISPQKCEALQFPERKYNRVRCAFGLSRFTEGGPYNIKSAVYKIGGASLFAKGGRI